jgi:hypothetical protein
MALPICPPIKEEPFDPNRTHMTTPQQHNHNSLGDRRRAPRNPSRPDLAGRAAAASLSLPGASHARARGPRGLPPPRGRRWASAQASAPSAAPPPRRRLPPRGPAPSPPLTSPPFPIVLVRLDDPESRQSMKCGIRVGVCEGLAGGLRRCFRASKHFLRSRMLFLDEAR